MLTHLLIRQRIVLGQEVQEPTLLALVLTITAFAVLLAVCVVAMAGLPAFGGIWWTFLAVAAILVGLVLIGRRKRMPEPAARRPTNHQQWMHRICGFARLLFIGLLACWLGLIVWSEFCPGGSGAPAKANPTFIRVVTWNIHCGQDEGVPWKRFDWPRRKHALRAALDQAQPDILCVQEATPEQVTFLEETLPGHERVGIGRDGEAGGEHCAIYFNRQRFEKVADSTFWLEEPIDQPRSGSALDVKRICTWVRLHDRTNNRTIRVYNTHLYLTESLRLTAARLILAHVAAGDRTDAVLLTADFNAGPSAPSRRLLMEAGLADSAERAGKLAGTPTFQLYGIGLWCIDGILVDSKWAVHDHRILDIKPNHTFPSDHFALLADIVLPRMRGP